MKLGTTDISKLYLGSNEVSKVMLGSDEVWSSVTVIPFELGTVTYDYVSFSVASQDVTPTGMTFNNDGTKMYVIGSINDSVYEYSLSTPYDISSASYVSLRSVSINETTPNGIAFSNDGFNMFFVGSTSERVWRYNFSSAFDISSSISAERQNISVSSQETTPHDLTFNNDGTKIYVIGYGTSRVYQYSLSEPFNLYGTQNMTYDNVSLSVSSQDGIARAVLFNNTGTKLFVLGSSNDAIFQYSLTTPYDLSTASYDNVSVSVATQEGTPQGFAFNNDGTKIYVVGSSGDKIYQYSNLF